MKYLVTFLLCWLLASSVWAQTNQKAAFEAYKKARNAYQNEQYNMAVRYLKQTKELLGSTNIRIQPMLIKSLAQVEDWRQVSKEVRIYYGLNPNRALQEYLEVKEIESKAKTRNLTEDRYFERIKRAKSVSQYQAYLDKYLKGAYREEVRKLLAGQKDENAWQKAKAKSTTAAYFEYLRVYPKGKYASTARSTIKRWDRESYEKAIETGTQYALNYYLNNYPRGEYRSQVRSKLKARIEYDVYMKAKKSDRIGDYENYVGKYPNGKYAGECNRVIQNFYYSKGNATFSNRYYKDAIRYYSRYLELYPNGPQAASVRSKLAKAMRLRYQYGGLAFNVTYCPAIQSVGLRFFGMDIRSVSGYTSLHGSWVYATATGHTVDNQGNTSLSNVRLTGITQRAGYAITAGPTLKLFYPVWIYAGGGYGSLTLFEEAETTSGVFRGDLDWFENTDELSRGFIAEGGIVLKIADAITLNYGVLYQGQIVHQIGIGIDVE
jgi:outer membrane protein assembly factor BamD (BamD/ComL family)